MLDLINFQNSKLPAMVKKTKEDLADYVRRIRAEKKLSLNDVARQSGNLISRGYISQIENRYIVSVTANKLQALAKGLGVSEDEIFAVARGKDPEGNPDFKRWKFASLFDEAEQLTPEQMAKFEILMEMARREVQRMLQEQERESPPKPARRVPDVMKIFEASKGKEKKRA